MAMTDERNRARAVAGLGAGPADETTRASDQPGNQPWALVPAPESSVAEPLVVPNQLWSPADPAAYDGGKPTQITPLADLDAAGIGRRDDARWTGLLEVIPTRADYVLDLLRAN